MKMTVKDLGAEVLVIKEQLKEIETLKQTVQELRKEVQDLKRNEDHSNNENEEFRCRNCDEAFKSLKLPKKHLLRVHPWTISSKETMRNT